MTCFGHAAYFGVGAYAAALAFKAAAGRCRPPWRSRPSAALARRGPARLVLPCGWRASTSRCSRSRSRRSSGRSCSSGTASPAAPTASSASGRPSSLSDRTRFYLFTLAVVAAALRLLVADHALAVRLRAARRRATRRCAPRRSASTCGRRSGARFALAGAVRRARRRPVRLLEGQHLARRRSRSRARSTRSSWCCSAASTRFPARCSAPAPSPGCRTRSRVRPTTGAPRSAR